MENYMAQVSNIAQTSVSDITNAKTVIGNFFIDYNSNDCKQYLWQMLKATFRRELSTIDDVEAMNLVGFYERIQDFMHATEIVYQNECLKE